MEGLERRLLFDSVRLTPKDDILGKKGNKMREKGKKGREGERGTERKQTG